MAHRNKVAVIGTGHVGVASAAAILAGDFAHEMVLIDRSRTLAEGVATDMRYGAVLQGAQVRAGEEGDIAACDLVVVTAGTNEKSGGAAAPDDPIGRLRLAEPNAQVYQQWAPIVARLAPESVFLVVTDPPDPLADLAATLAPDLQVISSGTLIDSLRMRWHLSEILRVAPEGVDAVVLGEHGRSAVQLWSQARVAGCPVEQILRAQGHSVDEVRAEVRRLVELANIAIIGGTGASQFGIGVAVARIARAILRDEQCVLPVGTRKNSYGVTLSLPSIVGREGVARTFVPSMTNEETLQLTRSAETIWEYSERIGAKRRSTSRQ